MIALSKRKNFLILIHLYFCIFIISKRNIVVYGSKAYPLGCIDKDPTYYDYTNHYPWPPPEHLCSSSEKYWLSKRLGSGKFSDVFEALEEENKNEENHFGLNDVPNYSKGRLVVIKVSQYAFDQKKIIFYIYMYIYFYS